MDIKHRFSFNVSGGDHLEVVDYLNKNNIKYEQSSGSPILTVEIFESSPHWTKFKELMNKHGKSSLVEKVFTQKELDEAEWLRIRSKWRWEYPQPEVKYTQITYDDSQYCERCGSGLIQKNHFRLKIEPKWGKRNFLMLNWIEDEIFINSEVTNIFINDIRGIEFINVLNNRSKESLYNISQMKVMTTLKKGLVVYPEDIKKRIVCTQCQEEKFIFTGRSKIKFERSIFPKEIDVVKSVEKFGDGIVCANYILVTNKFYQLIKDNEIGKDLVFEPIELF